MSLGGQILKQLDFSIYHGLEIPKSVSGAPKSTRKEFAPKAEMRKNVGHSALVT